MAGWIRRLPPQMKGPAMARALTTPSTIVTTGAVAAVAIVAGLPALVVGGLAALAYGVKSALTVARPKELAKVVFPDIGIDLSRLDATGLEQIQDALVARQHFRAALKSCPPGPFRDRFGEMGDQVDDVVEGLYKLVLRAQALRSYLAAIAEGTKTAELFRAQANLRTAKPGPTHDELAGLVEALEEQLAARHRVQTAYDGVLAKIGATTARVEQLSAQLTELVLLADDRAAAATLPGARSDVAGLVEELESMRRALDEMGAGQGVPVPPSLTGGGAQVALPEGRALGLPEHREPDVPMEALWEAMPAGGTPDSSGGEPAASPPGAAPAPEPPQAQAEPGPGPATTPGAEPAREPPQAQAE